MRIRVIGDIGDATCSSCSAPVDDADGAVKDASSAEISRVSAFWCDCRTDDSLDMDDTVEGCEKRRLRWLMAS